MQLITFEKMLIDRLNATGKVQAAAFSDAGVPLLYGVVVKADKLTTYMHLTRGSGTGDVKATDEEQELHLAKVAALKTGNVPRSGGLPEVDQLIRQVLLDPMPPGAVLVEGQVDGRERPGVRVRFETGADIYCTPPTS